MKNKVEVNLNAYDLTQATEMYAKEKGSDEWKMYQTLYDGENRILRRICARPPWLLRTSDFTSTRAWTGRARSGR